MKIRKQIQLWDQEYILHGNKWRKETKNISPLIKNKKVLEIGAGNGKTLKAILRERPQEVTAIDLSSKAINLLRANFKNKNIKIKKASALNLPFRDNSFDVVFIYYILNNLLRKQRNLTIKEAYRVINKKGKIIFEDLAVGDFREKGKKAKNDKHTIIKKSGLICHFFTLKELNHLFKDFSKRRIKYITSTPLRNNKKIVRRIISGIIYK